MSARLEVPESGSPPLLNVVPGTLLVSVIQEAHTALLPRRAWSRLWALGRWMVTACWTPGTLGRVPVRFHWSCLVFPGAVGFWWAHQLRGWVGVGLMFLLLEACAVSLVAHEFGHVLAARRHGRHCRMVIVLPIGAAAVLDGPLPVGRGEVTIALAGPAVNLVLALGLGIARWLLPSPGGCRLLADARSLGEGLVLFNLILGLGNLAPVFPRDGGQVLRAVLARACQRWRRCSELEAQRIATRLALRWVALPLTVAWLAAVGLWTRDLVLMVLLMMAAVPVHALGELELSALRSPAATPPNDPRKPGDRACEGETSG